MQSIFSKADKCAVLKHLSMRLCDSVLVFGLCPHSGARAAPSDRSQNPLVALHSLARHAPGGRSACDAAAQRNEPRDRWV